MRRLVQATPEWMLELVPALAGLVVSFFYLIAVLPEVSEFGGRFWAVAGCIFLLTRIPREWYRRTRLLPPRERYERARREGRTLGRTELEAFYVHMASYVPATAIVTGANWVCALALLIPADQIWLVGTPLSALAILFSFLIAASTGMILSYFLVKEKLRPVLEEVQTQLTSLPDVARWRFSFRSKMFGLVTAMGALAMLAFGLLLYSLMHRSAEEMALGSGKAQLTPYVSASALAADGEQEGLAESHSSSTYGTVLIDPAGKVRAGCGPTCHGGADSAMARDARKRIARLGAALHTVPTKGRRGEIVQTAEGRALVWDLEDGSRAAVVLHPGALDALMRPVMVGGLIFLVLTLLVFTTLITLLGNDQSHVLSRIEGFSRRLAGGDLRSGEAIWNDDELGRVSDHLRATFLALRRMVGEAKQASLAVDREVQAETAAAEQLRRQLAEQNQATASSSQAVAAVAGGIQSIQVSVEAVSGETQEVSSAILEMQASVEEISSNAGTLRKSVETSVSTTNEITAAAQQMSEAGARLQEAARESVAFFTQLDAALEETRRNAEGLRASSTKVTQDAEVGFSMVAAVEEEILRIRKAGEQNREAFERLRGSMERIGKIVDVIQEVTEQTNLLALNASIIAAGAGEHGRAFAVVATQVRELSGRTAGHAGEIRGVIRTLLESGRDMSEAIARTGEVVATSTDLSRRAGEALRTILESASSQEDMSRRIAAATEELAHGGQASNRSMHNISEMAEGIGGATGEQAKATRFLNAESERVRGVAEILKNAIEEQARGAGLISDAVNRITADSEEVTAAVRTQSEETESIGAALRELSATADGISRAADVLASASLRLRHASEALGGEIERFQL